MGEGSSRNEPSIYGRLVLLTATSDYRKAWRILRTDCHLTHHQVRAIFSEHYGGLALHSNLIHTELKKDEQEWAEAAEAFALMLNDPSHIKFADRLKDAIWGSFSEPQMCLTLVRRIDKTVRSWNGWGEKERNFIRSKVIRRLTNHEKRTGLEAYRERLLATYLTIRGVVI